MQSRPEKLSFQKELSNPTRGPALQDYRTKLGEKHVKEGGGAKTKQKLSQKMSNRVICREKKQEKTTAKGGFGSKWTPDIRSFLIKMEGRKVGGNGPNLPLKKGKFIVTNSESQNREGGGVGDMESERESLRFELEMVQSPQS